MSSGDVTADAEHAERKGLCHVCARVAGDRSGRGHTHRPDNSETDARGLAGSVIVGTLGAVLAGVVLMLTTGSELGGISVADVAAAAIGAVAVFALFRPAAGTTERRITWGRTQ